ncbi:MAG: GIY-YIG nuclease family protein [Candidatus Nealsonbacteria bacterium]
MIKIIEKSGILPWSIKNIKDALSKTGVYVLRNDTSVEGIIYIGSTNNLERRLMEHFLSENIPEVLFFDWYQTSSIENARDLERSWIIKYNPKYNEKINNYR